MAQWYFVEKGKPVGPMSEAELIQAATEGRLGPIDLIFKEGSERWVPAGDLSFVSEVLQVAAKDYDVLPQWIILKRKLPSEGVGYIQSGPFSSKEVRDKLQSGDIEYDDYVWKDGNEKWSKIAKTREFNPEYEETRIERLSSSQYPEIPSVQEEIPGKKLLENVLRARLPEADISPTKPQIDISNAETADFEPIQPEHLEASDSLESKEERRKEDKGKDSFRSAEALNSPEKEAFLRERRQRNPVKQTKEKQKNGAPVVVKKENFTDEAKARLFELLPSLPVGVFLTLTSLSLLVAGAWLIYSSFPDRDTMSAHQGENRPEARDVGKSVGPDSSPKMSPPLSAKKSMLPQAVESKKIQEKSTADKEEPPSLKMGKESPKKEEESLSAVKATTPKVWPRVVPTQLKIRSMDWKDSKKARIVFLTNGSHHFPISLVLQAKAGKIVGSPSYWRRLYLKAKPGEERSLMLSSLRLKEGTYQIDAEIDKVNTSTRIFVGSKTSQFLTDLEKYRKKISYSHQREKKRLFSAAEKIIYLGNEFNRRAPALMSQKKEFREFYQDWSKKLSNVGISELNIQAKTASNYLYPEEWMNLKEYRNGLLREGRVLYKQSGISPTNENFSEYRRILAQLTKTSQSIKGLTLW